MNDREFTNINVKESILLDGKPVVVTDDSVAPSIGDTITFSGTYWVPTQRDVENLLDNGGFEVWQRGAGPFTTSGFTADRWQIQVSGTTSVTRVVSTIGTPGYSVRINNTAYIGSNAFSQFLTELLPQLKGKTITFSVKVKANVSNRVFAAVYDGVTYSVSAFNSTTSEETLVVTKTISASATQLRIYIQLQGGTVDVEMNDAVCVFGSIPAPYVPRHPAEELARCQRYYEVFPGALGIAPRIRAYVLSGVAIYHSLFYSTRKPTTPTVTKNGTWVATGLTGQPTIHSPTVNGFNLTATKDGTSGMYDIYPNDASCTITVEANP
jgi:hypothetical protein